MTLRTLWRPRIVSGPWAPKVFRPVGDDDREWMGKDWEQWHLEHPYIPHPRDRAAGPEHTASTARSLQEGKTTTVAPHALSPLLDHLAAAGTPTDISKLDVSGAGNENLFTKCNPCIPRDQMPVVPASDHEMTQAFADDLASKGISSSFESVDPRTLTPSQSQLDGAKAGQMLAKLRDNEGKDPRSGTWDSVLVVDKDGTILDGHHRWAANSAYAVDHPGHTVNIMRADTDIDSLLDHTREFDKAHGIESRSFGQHPPSPAKSSWVDADIPKTNEEWGKRSVDEQIEKVKTARANPGAEGVPMAADAWREARGMKIHDPTTRRLFQAADGNKRAYNFEVKQQTARAAARGVEDVRPEVRAAMTEAMSQVAADPKMKAVADKFGLEPRFSVQVNSEPERGDPFPPRASYVNGSHGLINLNDASQTSEATAPRQETELNPGYQATPGGTLASRGWQGTITHELGHGVEDEMRAADDPRVGEWRHRWARYEDDFGTKLAQADDRGREMANSVSFYSTTNEREGFAETFNAVMAPGYSPDHYGERAQPLLALMDDIVNGEPPRSQYGKGAGLMTTPQQGVLERQKDRVLGRPPVPDPDGAWIWADGAWRLVATDDADGVPRTLRFPSPKVWIGKEWAEGSHPRDADGRFTSGGGGGGRGGGDLPVHEPHTGGDAPSGGGGAGPGGSDVLTEGPHAGQPTGDLLPSGEPATRYSSRNIRRPAGGARFTPGGDAVWGHPPGPLSTDEIETKLPQLRGAKTKDGEPVTPQISETMTKATDAAAELPEGKVHLPSGRKAKKPMTDKQYAAHREHVNYEITRRGGADPEFSPYSTHVTEDYIEGRQGKYTAEREAVHEQIRQQYRDRAAKVRAADPEGHKAIVMSGLGGAGKTTVLQRDAANPDSVAGKLGIKYASYDKDGRGEGDPTNFLVLNPDDIKENLAQRGLSPHIDQLSPLEGSSFLHEESSTLTKEISKEMEKSGVNIIHDVTLKNEAAVNKRIPPLKAQGYHVSGVLVDVPISQSLKSAASRHRSGMDEYNAGVNDIGERFVPSGFTQSLAYSGSPDAKPSWGGDYKSDISATFDSATRLGSFEHTLTVDNDNYADRLVQETGG